MILAWVISLLLLCSSLIVSIERLGSLRIVEVSTMSTSQKNFIAAEAAVEDCEGSITTLSSEQGGHCFIQSIGSNRWLISSKEKPGIQIGVLIDEKTGLVTRLNWRQVFEY